jgi:hypothetical protein
MCHCERSEAIFVSGKHRFPPQSAGGSVQHSALWTDPTRCLAELRRFAPRNDTHVLYLK